MMAIREIQEVKSSEVTITLPPDFRAKRVEIIILPLDELVDAHEANQIEEQQQFQALLLQAPVLAADELQDYVKVREWMREWLVNKF